MKRARFVAPARREFLAQVAYYTQVAYYNGEEPGLGARFATAVEARAAAFPHSGSPSLRDTRRVFVKDFPFSVVYRPEKNGIIIFAAAHHSRRPEYWQPRIRGR